MSNNDLLWYVLFFIFLNERKEKNMIEVTATIKNRDGQKIRVQKDEKTGEVIIARIGINDTYNAIQADGKDIIQAIMSVGGLFNGFPFGLPDESDKVNIVSPVEGEKQ